MNSNKAPTNDLTFRKVIMHAVNKAAIIDKELYGFAEPVDAVFPKNAPYCDLDLTPRWDYDFEKAKLLHCPTEAAAIATITTGTASSGNTITGAAQQVEKVITGTLDMTVPNADEFISDTSAQNAVKEGIAAALDVPASYIGLVVAKASSRRLQERVLQETGVVITYTVTIPPEVSSSAKDTVVAAANSVTADTLTTAIQSKVTDAKGSNYPISVTAKATPTISTGTAATTTAGTTATSAPATSQSSSDDDDDSDGIGTGAIIGIVVGGLVVICCASIAMYMYGKKQGVLQEQLLQQSKQSSAQYQQQEDVVGKPDKEASV